MISLENRYLNDRGKTLGHRKPDRTLSFACSLSFIYVPLHMLEPQHFLPIVLPTVYVSVHPAICLLSCHHLLLVLQKTLFCLILQHKFLKQILQLFNPLQPHRETGVMHADQTVPFGKERFF